jgi:hypothetical protein
MKKILMIIGVVLIILTGVFIWMKNYFLFMPWEYHKSDALYLSWYEYHGEIEMYMGSYETEDGSYYVHITDRQEIKNVLEMYMEVSNVTHSRKEIEQANFPDDWGESYVIEISRVDERDSEGIRISGENLFVTYVYENTTLAKSYQGVYYYFNVTDDFHNFVINYPIENE